MIHGPKITIVLIFFTSRSGPESLWHGGWGRGARGGRCLAGGGDVWPGHMQSERRPDVRQLHYVRPHSTECCDHYFISAAGWNGRLLAVWRRFTRVWHTPPAAPRWSAPEQWDQRGDAYSGEFEVFSRTLPLTLTFFWRLRYWRNIERAKMRGCSKISRKLSRPSPILSPCSNKLHTKLKFLTVKASQNDPPFLLGSLKTSRASSKL